MMSEHPAGAAVGQDATRRQRRPTPIPALEAFGQAFDAELDTPRLAQSIIDIATQLVDANVGSFVYRVADDKGSTLGRATAGPGSAAVSTLPPADITVGEAIRLECLADDAAEHKALLGLPPSAAVGSYLAVPVRGRQGDLLGAMCFGHPARGRFLAEHERLIGGAARLAAVALDNAMLSQRARAGDLANARLAAIVQSSDDAIVSKDLEGIVQSWNAGAQRMFGYSAEEMVGRSVTVLFPPDRPDEEAGILARLRRGERVDHFETVRRTKQGRLIDVSVTISPVRDASGRIVGASKVARDITERKRAEVERDRLLGAERSARALAEHHSRMKDEFLATLGHELRTPLNAILGWAHLIRKKSEPGAEIEQGLTVIERNARLQAQLIEDLLDMSRIIAGKLRLDVQPVDLPAVVLAALEAVRPAADAKGVRIQETIGAYGGTVSGDPNRLQQVVWNLLSNAVKFTPRGGRVTVVVERTDSHVRITVSDTGEGIDPAFLPLVFDRFRQADASTTRQHGGLGLGLAIVRHLVELHGGTVEAASEGKGKGSAFSVNLPLRAIREGSVGQALASDTGNSEPGLSLAGLTVMVVDDEADSCELLRRVLSDAGASVCVTESVRGALAAFPTCRPDVIVSDIGMPVEDGYALLKKVRKMSAADGGRTPAIALTAFARPEDRRQALLAGFQMHVPKPVEPAELLAAIASVTNRV